MRRKKLKHVKKAVRFYRINYGFRPPFKVIVDGNFCHALESMKRGDAKDLVSKLLGDQVKVFTTKCVMHELRTLGKEYAGTRQACKRYALHKCGHDDADVSAADCLLAQLGEKNSEHFLIATQDRGLQRSVMRVPGGACIFASVNGVHLETPSAMQQKQVKQKEEEHMAVRPQEKRALGEVGQQGPAQQQQQPGGGAAAGFQRKRPKGPNPLSMKPKQKKAKVQPQHAQHPKQQQDGQEGGAGEGAQQKEGRRKRVRRKRGGHAATAEDGE